MSTAQIPPDTGTAAAPPGQPDPRHGVDEDRVTPPGRWVAFGAANFAVVVVVSIAGWYLLADPELSPWDLYPMPFNAVLFWAILFVVFVGFNGEFALFDQLVQPWRGLMITVATVVFAVAVTWVLSAGLGSVNADFAPSRDGGLGYFTGALFVLFGFGTFVIVVLNWQHWPWPQLGLRQPAVGLAEVAAVTGPTILLYVALGLPAVTAGEAAPLMSLDTVMGWFYSVIVAIILTGQTLDNWPWRLAGRPGRVAVVSTVGNVVLGTIIYFAVVSFVEVLLPSAATEALGSTINQFAAQFGVCWVFWMVFWANAFGNRPTRSSAAANYVMRFVLTLVLAVITFAVYYRLAAEHILHEPSVAPGISGNALGFIDWMVLVTLLYVVAFESFGLRTLNRA
jgi:AAT family amino acid transporter